MSFIIKAVVSFVTGEGLTVTPKELKTKAGELRGIGDRVAASSATADQSTAAVVAPGGDEVSAKMAGILDLLAADYWEKSSAAVTYIAESAAALSKAADAYSTTEADNAKRTG